VFGQPEVNLGIVPGFGGTQRLTRLVGKGMALELCTTGRQVRADEALRIGLANHVVLPGAARKGLELAQMIVQKGPLACASRSTSSSTVRTSTSATPTCSKPMCSALPSRATTVARHERLLEKRKPVFTGR